MRKYFLPWQLNIFDQFWCRVLDAEEQRLANRLDFDVDDFNTLADVRILQHGTHNMLSNRICIVIFTEKLLCTISKLFCTVTTAILPISN